MIVLVPTESVQGWVDLTDFRSSLLGVAALETLQLVHCCFEGSLVGQNFLSLLQQGTCTLGSTDILDLGMDIATVNAHVDYMVKNASPQRLVVVVAAAVVLATVFTHRTERNLSPDIIASCSAIRLN